VEAKSPTELELTFSKSIDQSVDGLREFKITKDNKEITKVKETKIVEDDTTKLTLILSNPIAT
jgi:methionine-rich copper-binding protein CopC